MEQTHRSNAWAMTTLAAIFDQGGGGSSACCCPPDIIHPSRLAQSKEETRSFADVIASELMMPTIQLFVLEILSIMRRQSIAKKLSIKTHKLSRTC